jgi:hypothetical protein
MQKNKKYALITALILIFIVSGALYMQTFLFDPSPHPLYVEPHNMFFITYFPSTNNNYPLEVANLKSIWNQTRHLPEIQAVSEQGNYSVLMYRHMYSGLAPDFYSEMWILVTTLEPDQNDYIHAYVLRFHSSAEPKSNQVTFKKSYNQTTLSHPISREEGSHILGGGTITEYGPFLAKGRAHILNLLTGELMIAAWSNDLGMGALLYPEQGDPRDI